MDNKDTNLVVSTMTELGLPGGAKINEQHLRLPPGLPFEDYMQVLRHLFWIKDRAKEAYDTSLWLIADALIYGEVTYGSEEFAQAVDLFDKSEKRLLNIRWVGRRVPPGRRRLTLSFEHHAEVASLPPEQQNELLFKAEKHNLTHTDLRRERHLLKDSTEEMEQYRWGEAQTALNRAADLVAQLPVDKWAKIIMDVLVKPLKHEVDRGHYREFVRALYEQAKTWRDVN